MKNTGIIFLDVRPWIARGEEPLPFIRERVAKLGPGEALAVKAPFIPSPLIELLKGEGFESTIEHQADASWVVTFRREAR